DIRALLFDRGEDGARVAVEAHVRSRVADVLDHTTNDRRNIDPCARRDLSSDDDHASLRERFACDACARVLCEDRVEDGIAHLIAELVGMAFGDGLGGKSVSRHELAALSPKSGGLRHPLCFPEEGVCGPRSLGSLPSYTEGTFTLGR